MGEAGNGRRGKSDFSSWGRAPADSKSPKILVVAHMDEIGFEVKSISKDGRLEVETLGGMDFSFYEGHPALVHTSGRRSATRSWNCPMAGTSRISNGPPNRSRRFAWTSARATQTKSPNSASKSARLDHDSQGISPAARHARERPQLGRSRGRTALISAVWALGGPLKDRDVTFVWSTGEEMGLVGAGALAEAPRRRRPQPGLCFRRGHVRQLRFAARIQTVRRRRTRQGFRHPRRGQFQHRAARSSRESREARARESNSRTSTASPAAATTAPTFVPYGAVDIALGWPLRYSHSPAEVIDTRDVDALARIVAVAKSW